jgi:phosphoribosyl-AMP cyclohydrolase
MSTDSRYTFASRDDRKAVETGPDFAPKFDSDGLIPAIAQDAESGEILMVAYMNEEALRLTLEVGEGVYYSRSRQEIWHKGKTSGHVQTVKEVLVDCDQDALVLKVIQHGSGACHTGYRSCFFRKVAGEGDPTPLEQVYTDKEFDPEKVYG